MALIQPDTSEAQEMTPIEPGTYPGVITEVEFKQSAAGNPMVVCKWEIDVEGKTRTRKSYLVVTGEGAFNFDQLLRSTGFTEVADIYKDPESDNPEFDTDSLVGQSCNVVIESQMYKDELRDSIKSYLPA